jgi:hypothetical protein
MKLTGWAKCNTCNHLTRLDLSDGSGLTISGGGCEECGGKNMNLNVGIDQPEWWDEEAFKRQDTKRLK